MLESKIHIQHKTSLTLFLKSLSDVLDVQDDSQTEDKRLDEAEGALGDHVTGGVVRSWRQVQSRLAEFSSEGKLPDLAIF